MKPVRTFYRVDLPAQEIRAMHLYEGTCATPLSWLLRGHGVAGVAYYPGDGFVQLSVPASIDTPAIRAEITEIIAKHRDACVAAARAAGGEV